QALPSTQAFFAFVIVCPSTVNSMSSQTQPQNVQVALLTIFSSVVAIVNSSRSGVFSYYHLRIGRRLYPEGQRRERLFSMISTGSTGLTGWESPFPPLSHPVNPVDPVETGNY